MRHSGISVVNPGSLSPTHSPLQVEADERRPIWYVMWPVRTLHGSRRVSRIVQLAVLGVVLISAPAHLAQTNQPASGIELLWKKLEAKVDQIVVPFDGVMGVAILDLTDGRSLVRNADQVFPTASSIKLAILLELYRQDQEARAGGKGKSKLDDSYTFDPKDLIEDSQIMAGLTPGVSRVTNRDLAQFMVAVSDNAATNVLYDRVGKDNVNAMLNGLGLTKTKLRRKMIDLAAARRGDENVSTPHEMVLLLDAIHKGKILNKEATAAFITQLSTLKKSSYLSTLLPDGVQVADKPGDLDGVRTDSGIVFAPNRPFAISIMTAWDRDHRAAEHAIAEIGLGCYNFFEMRGKTTEYGRILPPVNAK
jgi:beta-lactamase class A